MHRRAAIDDEHLACDEITFRGSEENRRPDDILRCLHALERTVVLRRGAHADDVLARILLSERAAWRDAVYADPVLADLACEHAREPNNAGLGCDVMDAARRAFDGGPGADVDDFPVATPLHVVDARTRGQPRPAKVDRHHTIPFVHR